MLGAQAQDAPAAKVEIKSVKVNGIETPQFQAGNVGDRRWRPKTWLEVDVEFDIKLPSAQGGRNGSLASMVMNVYLGFNHKTKDNKTEFIKGSFTCVDVPAGQSCHLLAYLPPAALRRIFEKDSFTPTSDVPAWGVEVMLDGTRAAGDSSSKTPWWEKSEAMSLVEGTLLSKQETPYGILWGDYDVTVKKQ